MVAEVYGRSVKQQLDCVLLVQAPLEAGVLGAPRDVVQAELESEAALQHPLAGRVRDETRREPLEHDALAHARDARRVDVRGLDASLERGPQAWSVAYFIA